LRKNGPLLKGAQPSYTANNPKKKLHGQHKLLTGLSKSGVLLMCIYSNSLAKQVNLIARAEALLLMLYVHRIPTRLYEKQQIRGIIQYIL
jgi:hypothetical protein